MMITEEMIAEDEKRWHASNIVAELGYCGKNIRHRKNITNDDIRFYAYIMRKAHALLKEQEPKLLTIEEITGSGECWFEGINGACGYADCYMGTGLKEVEVHRISMKPEYVLWDDFKKKWRCWSYRPTDEQRKAAKWE